MVWKKKKIPQKIVFPQNNFPPKKLNFEMKSV